MSTHTVTIELDESSFNILKNAVIKGNYASESEAAADLLPEIISDRFELSGDRVESPAWLDAEAAAAMEEYEKNPADVYTMDEVKAYFTEKWRKAGL